MQLTTQMAAEVEAISARIWFINKEHLEPMVMGFVKNGAPSKDRYKPICLANMEELNSCKVRLENILCETDEKEQDHLHNL